MAAWAAVSGQVSRNHDWSSWTFSNGQGPNSDGCEEGDVAEGEVRLRLPELLRRPDLAGSVDFPEDGFPVRLLDFVVLFFLPNPFSMAGTKRAAVRNLPSH